MKHQLLRMKLCFWPFYHLQACERNLCYCLPISAIGPSIFAPTNLLLKDNILKVLFVFLAAFTLLKCEAMFGVFCVKGGDSVKEFVFLLEMQPNISLF